MAVIKYRESATENRFETDPRQDREIGSVWKYEECYNPSRKGRDLTRDEALDLIREKGLVIVHKTPDGVIWDRPDEPLRKRYGRI